MLMEPHLSGTVLIMGIGASMMFVGGTGIIWFVLAVLGAVAGVAGAVVLSRIWSRMRWNASETWQNPGWILWEAAIRRFKAFMPSVPAASPAWESEIPGRNICIFRNRTTILFFCDLRRTWFYRRIVGHFLFIALLLRGLYIAYTAKDKFGSMLVVGIMVQVILQAVLNIGVVTNTIPNTGISLRFFPMAAHRC